MDFECAQNKKFKEGDPISFILVAPRNDDNAIADKKFVTKDAGIHHRLSPGNDAEMFLVIEMHFINDKQNPIIGVSILYSVSILTMSRYVTKHLKSLRF